MCELIHHLLCVAHFNRFAFLFFPTEEKDLSVPCAGDDCSYHLQRARGERKEPSEKVKTC